MINIVDSAISLTRTILVCSSMVGLVVSAQSKHDNFRIYRDYRSPNHRTKHSKLHYTKSKLWKSKINPLIIFSMYKTGNKYAELQKKDVNSKLVYFQIKSNTPQFVCSATFSSLN